MVIYFRTKKLQKTCSERVEMQKQLGKPRAEKLSQRMMELKAADTLADMSHLPPCNCHKLDGERAGQFAVDLAQPYRLLFLPFNNPVPYLENGEIDKTEVTEIEIIEITDYH